MKVLIRNEHPKIKVDSKKIEQQIGNVLRSLNCNNHEISILFIGDQGIRDINHRYRGIDRSTDVLSFPQLVNGKAEISKTPILGDIAISLDTALRQTKNHGLSLGEELTLLLIHGIF